MRRRNAHPPRDSGAGALAAVVGHELNNIAVPLEGFTESAMQGSAADEATERCFDEARLAIQRIKALASDLESLGESASRLAPVRIGDCMPDHEGRGLPVGWMIDWRVGAGTTVAVDRLHARLAIQSLANLAKRTDSELPPLMELTVSLGLPPGARCADCGAAIPPRGNAVLVQAYSSRPVRPEGLRDPFGSSAAGSAVRRLSLAVLSHSAHCAGGHVLLDEASWSLGVAFNA